MRVCDIWPEVIETTGTCDAGVNLCALTRAVELLANEGSFDPLLGTIDFYVENAYLLALPRDVKTPLRLNINNNPAFARNRIFEFSPNAPGSVDGPEVGWQWHDRGYSPIQDETKLPSKLRYNVTVDADIGKTVTIIGTDTAGRRRKEVLVGASVDHAYTKYAYGEILSIIRQATVEEAYLWADAGSIARYYADEEQPEYRVIKLAQTGVAVRMLYRKHVFKLTSTQDIIPLHSPMAVIRAVEAVRLMQKQKFADAQPILAEAVRMIGKEQEARDEGTTLAGALEVASVTNTNILTNDVLLVADIYDRASEILGPIGRAKIFDRISDAIEILQNKAQWDSTTGECVLRGWTHKRDGYFVLPRGIDTVLAVNVGRHPTSPRNRWFEFHLNGPGTWGAVSCGSWIDKGDTPIIDRFPGDGTPLQLAAIVENALDADKEVTIYGVERRSDGSETAIIRNGIPGYVVPCKTANYTLPSDAPAIIRVDRIHREKTIGFVRLIGHPVNGAPNILLGFWQPDEVEPNYRIIRVASYHHHSVRIRYRKRSHRINSLTDVLNLRSRVAMENMLRSIAKQGSDPQAAAIYEATAVQYLEEEQLSRNPHAGGTLQFEPGMSPGDFMPVQ